MESNRSVEQQKDSHEVWSDEVEVDVIKNSPISSEDLKMLLSTKLPILHTVRVGKKSDLFYVNR